MLDIITTTYNRINDLRVLYESLSNQSCKDFRWIVIDDGSTDCTYDFISNIKCDFEIECIRKNNSGKQSSLNFALDNFNGEYYTVVDSDDRLTPKAIETVYADLKKLVENDEITGLAYNTVDFYGNLNGTTINGDSVLTTIERLYSDLKILGDKWFVFRRSNLLELRFPVFPPEKFTPESNYYHRLSRNIPKPNVLYLNKSLLVRDYRKGGYTDRTVELRKLYPMGFLLLDYENIASNNFKVNIFYFKAIANICRTLIIGSSNRFSLAILFIPAFCIALVKFIINDRKRL